MSEPGPISEVLTRSVTQVFNERDAARRAELVAATYAPGIVFHDPDGTVTGREGFGAKIAELLEGTGGLSFSLRRPVQESAGLGVASWQLGPAGQPPVATGTDVALVEDGLVTTMWTLLDG
jgi:SnoaL-like protein